MMDIFKMLGGMNQTQNTLGQRLGTSPQQTEAAMEAAIPLLLGAMTRNAQDPQGAQSLAGALDQHDGRTLDFFGQGQAPDPSEGQRILGKVFGGQQQAAANAVSRRAGIDPQIAMQLLSMAAPLVLAYLSRRRQGQSGGMGQGQMGGVQLRRETPLSHPAHRPIPHGKPGCMAVRLALPPVVIGATLNSCQLQV